MNESGEGTVTKRNWQVLFGLLYVGLFLFLFVVKPAPEQKLRASIGIAASEAEVASLLRTGQPVSLLDEWAALLLTKKEQTDIALEPQSSRVVLTVETHWQVRGGLLGKVVDQMIGRPARVHALTATLRRIKAQAEEQHTKRV